MSFNIYLKMVTSLTPVRDNTHDACTKRAQNVHKAHIVTEGGAHAPTPRALHNGNSAQQKAQRRTHKNMKMTRRAKIIVKVPKVGENEHLPGDKVGCEQQALRGATYGDLKGPTGSNAGVFEVRDAL